MTSTDKILKRVSKEFNLPVKEIKKMYSLYYQEVKNILIAGDTIERSSITIPYIGKLIYHKDGRFVSKESKTD